MVPVQVMMFVCHVFLFSVGKGSRFPITLYLVSDNNNLVAEWRLGSGEKYSIKTEK